MEPCSEFTIFSGVPTVEEVDNQKRLRSAMLDFDLTPTDAEINDAEMQPNRDLVAA